MLDRNLESPIRYERTYRRLVANTTINDKTLLSTDYLNHYNEAVMLLDLVPEIPEMLEDLESWIPKSYQEHFRDSVFSHKDLAIAAYDHAPLRYRRPMDECCTQMDTALVQGMVLLEEAKSDGVLFAQRANALAEDVRVLIARTSAIINGEDESADTVNDEMAIPETTMDQDAIDALFD